MGPKNNRHLENQKILLQLCLKGALRGYIFQKLILALNFSCININCYFIKETYKTSDWSRSPIPLCTLDMCKFYHVSSLKLQYRKQPVQKKPARRFRFKSRYSCPRYNYHLFFYIISGRLIQSHTIPQVILIKNNFGKC